MYTVYINVFWYTWVACGTCMVSAWWWLLMLSDQPPKIADKHDQTQLHRLWTNFRVIFQHANRVSSMLANIRSTNLSMPTRCPHGAGPLSPPRPWSPQPPAGRPSSLRSIPLTPLRRLGAVSREGSLDRLDGGPVMVVHLVVIWMVILDDLGWIWRIFLKVNWKVVHLVIWWLVWYLMMNNGGDC